MLSSALTTEEVKIEGDITAKKICISTLENRINQSKLSASASKALEILSKNKVQINIFFLNIVANKTGCKSFFYSLLV